MKRKTATIERYHCYGTVNHHLRVYYRGKTLKWANRDPEGYYLGESWADMVDYGQESIDAARQHAKRQGFSHVKFTGEWSHARKPKGGKL